MELTQLFLFKLYETAHNWMLQKMGRRLKERLPRYGFVRMEQTLYALLYPSSDEVADNDQNDVVHVELIDSMLLGEQTSFMQRANRFFEKVSSIGLLYEKGYIDNTEGVIKNYYIDILDAYIDSHVFPKPVNNTNEISCYFIRGFHKHIDSRGISTRNQSINNLLPLESCFDIGAIENRNADNGMEGAR
jgi:hypothetical protein